MGTDSERYDADVHGRALTGHDYREALRRLIHALDEDRHSIGYLSLAAPAVRAALSDARQHVAAMPPLTLDDYVRR